MSTLIISALSALSSFISRDLYDDCEEREGNVYYAAGVASFEWVKC